MEKSQINKAMKKKNHVIDNFDDFNIDDLSFKPINEGLGFHHNEKRASFKKVEKQVIRTHMGSIKQREIPRQNRSKVIQPALSNLGLSKDMPGMMSKSTLDVFYGETNKKLSQKNSMNKDVNNFGAMIEKEETSFFISFVAWLVDTIIISFFALMTTLLFILVSGIEFSQLIELLPRLDKIIFISLVFSSIYILYFSILDLASSPGKVLLGLNLEKIDNSKLRLQDTFIRSLISLFSLFLLGVPNFFNISGKTSQTRLVS